MAQTTIYPDLPLYEERKKQAAIAASIAEQEQEKENPIPAGVVPQGVGQNILEGKVINEPTTNIKVEAPKPPKPNTIKNIAVEKEPAYYTRDKETGELKPVFMESEPSDIKAERAKVALERDKLELEKAKRLSEQGRRGERKYIEAYEEQQELNKARYRSELGRIKAERYRAVLNQFGNLGQGVSSVAVPAGVSPEKPYQPFLDIIAPPTQPYQVTSAPQEAYVASNEILKEIGNAPSPQGAPQGVYEQVGTLRRPEPLQAEKATPRVHISAKLRAPSHESETKHFEAHEPFKIKKRERKRAHSGRPRRKGRPTKHAAEQRERRKEEREMRERS
jgi:hypothetical protein